MDCKRRPGAWIERRSCNYETLLPVQLLLLLLLVLRLLLLVQLLLHRRRCLQYRFETDEYHERRSIQQVDYPHGLHLQHRASLHMDQEMYDCELQDVVSVRAALHFVHLWKRNARKKLLRRLLYDVLLAGWTLQMPPAVIQNIYAFVRS